MIERLNSASHQMHSSKVFHWYTEILMPDDVQIMDNAIHTTFYDLHVRSHFYDSLLQLHEP